MKKWMVFMIASLFAMHTSAIARQLDTHFLGAEPKCSSHTPVPVLIVADVTRSGEIDDSISLFMYSRLEHIGCIKVIGVVSIFGNGGLTTGEVHQNLLSRLRQLKLTGWPVFMGPSKRIPFETKSDLNTDDVEKLTMIASQIKAHGKVVISELGPFTVSAALLKSELIGPDSVIKILGVGGRAEGEHFSQNAKIPFSFRDMNVAEDRMAVKYLLQFHASKLWTVTYRTGIGARMIDPEIVGEIGNDELTLHAHKRAKMLKKIGYSGKVPSWDTWTTSWFLKGGANRLGCKRTKALMIGVAIGYKPSDSLQLRLAQGDNAKGTWIESCHSKVN